MSTQMLSPFERLAPYVLDNIAILAGRNAVLGPPSDLIALACSSKKLYNSLSFHKNKFVWGNVLKFKFDTDAINRRLGDGWTTLGCIAEEGRKRFAAMRRIRQKAVTGPYHLDDLWTAYLMMLESDGKNEAQLIEWADIRRYLYAVIRYRASTPIGASLLWFADSEGTGLAVWLLWMTSSAGK